MMGSRVDVRVLEKMSDEIGITIPTCVFERSLQVMVH